jgi:transcriptional regulator with GAF, ATPase, and Fis domain
VLARIWIVNGSGDLDLLSSAGSPTGGGSYRRVDGEFSRIARGRGKIGQIVATREPLVVRSIRGDEEWLVNPGWIARQAVRSFAGLPLIVAADVVGVFALFSRAALTDQSVDELRFLAEYMAVRLRSLSSSAPGAPAAPSAPSAPGILTRTQLRDLERRSLELALAQTKGKIFGADGAAALLDMKPTTLASRIKALGIST